jgi:tetratricopeptide (TPR) repeat protein
VSDYTISGLLGRLEEANDQERLTAVAERLLQVGGSSQSLTTSDRVVLAALDSRLARGDVHGARTLVPRLISPSRVVQLLTDKKYDAVRDTASAHAGPRFARLWPGYLARAETDSRSHEDGLGPRIYAQALSQAGADSRLISTFHPMFSSPIDEEQDESLIFAASPLAAALARKGRWDEALQVFESALRTWPDENNALALNLSGNRGRLLVLKGDFAAGVAQLDAVIATANQIGGQVNDAAVAAFHYYRACALHRLGRGKEAATSEGVVARRGTLDPEQVIGLHICRDNLPAAKRALMEALESEESRGDALRLVQPSDERTLASDWARQVKKAWDELRTDADVRAAALRHGYILPEPANAAVRDAGI